MNRALLWQHDALLTLRAAAPSSGCKPHSGFTQTARLLQSSLRKRACKNSRTASQQLCQAVQQSVDEQAFSSQDSTAGSSADMIPSEAAPLPDGACC